MRKMIQIQKETHANIKKQAALKEMTMEKFVEYLIEKYMRDLEDKK